MRAVGEAVPAREPLDQRDRRVAGGVDERGEAPAVLVGQVPPRSFSDAREQPHQLVLGVLAERAGDLGAVDPRELVGAPRPRAANRSRTPPAIV